MTSRRLKELRMNLSLSQAQMAEIMGIKQNAYSNIENGKTSLTDRNKNALIDKLNLPDNFFEVEYSPSLNYLDTASLLNLSHKNKNEVNREFAERLNMVISHLRLSVVDFSKKINEDASVITKMLGSYINISASILNKTASKFPEISSSWLLTGVGEMIERSIIGQPYYNIDFIGGFDIVINEQTATPDYYIDFTPYNKPGVVWCNITGRSMEPEINSGDIIALKEVTTQVEYLPFGEIYAIVTDEYRTVKRISKSEKDGCIRLIPTNKSPEFVPQDIPVSLIRKVYQVLGSMKRF